MLNKTITAVSALILLALACKGIAWGNGYLADVQRAARQRQAVYTTLHDTLEEQH